MAQIRLRSVGNTVRTVVRIRVRDETNTLRVVQRVRIRDAANFLRTVYSPFAVTVVPGSVSGYGSSGAAANITTGSATASASGGTSPFTYAWTQVGSTGVTWTIGTPAAASTTFTAGTVGAGAVESATFQCAATDASGNTATVQIRAFANNGQPYDPDAGGDGLVGRSSTL